MEWAEKKRFGGVPTRTQGRAFVEKLPACYALDLFGTTLIMLCTPLALRWHTHSLRNKCCTTTHALPNAINHHQGSLSVMQSHAN